jgi:surface antigen
MNFENKMLLNENKSPILIILALALSFTGCAQQQEMRKELVDSRKLLIADQPTYSPGEFFEYENGLSMIVVDSQDGMITWKYSNEATSSGYANFLVPQLSWEGSGSRGSSKTNASQGFLWPLNIGGFGRFDITQTIVDATSGVPETLARRWECGVEGTEKVAVPAGKFDTYIVTCNRYTTNGNEWRGRHIYYYSPDIRHYVKLEKNYARRSTRIEQLKNYGFNSQYLPIEEQSELKKLLYRTLADGKPGISQSWTNGDGTISAMLIPYQSYRGANGQPCREYKSLYNVEGRVYHHTRKACQAADGSWQRNIY